MPSREQVRRRRPRPEPEPGLPHSLHALPRRPLTDTRDAAHTLDRIRQALDARDLRNR